MVICMSMGVGINLTLYQALLSFFVSLLCIPQIGILVYTVAEATIANRKYSKPVIVRSPKELNWCSNSAFKDFAWMYYTKAK